MADALRKQRFTFAEYVALEEGSNVKHEFLGGEIYAMAGGTPGHARLAMTIGSALDNQLRGTDCRVFSSDLRVRVPATGLGTYPDITVVCGASERDRENPSTVVNPRIIIEVLSDRTEAYDRGEKFEHYKTIQSLKEYVLVSHREPAIDVWRREDGSWVSSRAVAGEMLAFRCLGCEIAVDDIYRDGLDP